MTSKEFQTLVLVRLDNIDLILKVIMKTQNKILIKETKMSVELDKLEAAVTAENTVIDSAITLINGLAAQIKALANDPVALVALSESIASKSVALSSAVTANTPPTVAIQPTV